MSGEFNEKDSSTLGIVAAQSNAGEIGLTTFRNTCKFLTTCTLIQ